MLAIDRLNVAYGQSQIIEEMSFSVNTGEIVAIVGRNGMGKTTLMRALTGMIGSTGHVQLDGTEITQMKPHQRVHNGLAIVPQGRMIFSTMSVKENIETGLAATHKRRVDPDIYALFPVLLEMRHRKGGNLSGGQQQQLAIARALATDPKVLLLDEPTEGIQPSIIKEMARTLREIRDQRGLTIIVSEQVLSFALDIAVRIVVLERGRIVVDEPRSEVDHDRVAAFLAV